MRSSIYRKSMLLIIATSSLFFANCVTRGFHESTIAKMNEQHNKELAQKTRQMEAQGQDLLAKGTALSAKNKQNKMLLARLKNECRQQITTLSDKNSAKANRLRKAMAYINRLEAKINDWKSLHTRLTKIFKVKIDEGLLSVQIERGLIILRMPEKVLFKLGSAKIMTAGQTMIEEVAKVLAREPYQWQVAGHADPTGKSEFNWNLSYRRAMAVLKVMVKSDMAPVKISAAAYGQYHPRTSNDTPEGRAQNRRTEIVFVPQIKALLMADVEKKISRICRPTQHKKSS